MSEFRVLITGGVGFLGFTLVQELIQHNEEDNDEYFEITVVDLKGPDDEQIEYFQEHSITFHTEDFRNENLLNKILNDGIDIVFHCASKVLWQPGQDDLLNDINVEGTKFLLKVSSENEVKRFVYVSSIDACFEGKEINNGREEDYDIAKKPFDTYGATKGLAEKQVRNYNGINGMATVACRPCGLYGPRDPYHISSVIKAAKSGQLIAKIGNGKSVYQHIYVGNIAHALICASLALESPDSKPAGRYYFITDYEASNFFTFMETYIEKLGYKKPKIWIPFFVAFIIACIMEFLIIILKCVGIKFEPTLTRHSVTVVTTNQSWNGDNARKDLKYEPKYTFEEAEEKTVEWFKAHPI